jgi:hypothetical protein
LTAEVNKLRDRKQELLSLIEHIDTIDKLTTEINKYRNIHSTCMKNAVQLNEQILNLNKQIDKFI